MKEFILIINKELPISLKNKYGIKSNKIIRVKRVNKNKIEEAGLELPWLVKLNKNMNLPLFRKEEDLYDYWIENFGDNLKIIAK